MESFDTTDNGTRLYTLLHEDDRCKELFNELLKYGNVFFVGDVARCLIENLCLIEKKLKSLKWPNVNVVVDIETHVLESIISKYEFKKNEFGGYKLSCNFFEIDMRNIEQIWTFKENLVAKETKNLGKMVFLNVDSIIYDLKNNTFYKDKYDDFIKTKIIDIVLEETPFSKLSFLDALELSRRYDAVFSDRLCRFFCDKYRQDATGKL